MFIVSFSLHLMLRHQVLYAFTSFYPICNNIFMLLLKSVDIQDFV